jgi:hypothetical protein
MHRRAIFVAVLIAAMAIAGVAGSADFPTDGSYFVGVWSGQWDMGPSTKQDITITIDPKNAKGYHKTTYDYGFVKSATGGTIPPGSFVIYGKEQDGVFIASFKNKEGAKRTLTMQKFKEDEVKARYDIEGSITSSQRPYYDAILKRR